MKNVWIAVAACLVLLFINIGCESKKPAETEKEKELLQEQEEIDGLV